ncbi:hypothetical protein MM221_17210 [Salipaludibacillus sp. LMS25]|uniref:hypothetical protein n=1 Tax=Salipaludibacillus sp. LMS25 TaxID=2924031 RepID=UPI0020D0A705|nr:hypothetical protein [Salipaludibacillus sp. LMS25]UTR14281.1 hypothetical protein MM221_17210 [Salipaludibacillus sp. LMS25]
MRTLASLALIGAGAFAYAASMNRKTRNGWKKRMPSMINFRFVEDIMPRKRTMRQMRRQMSKAFS